VCSTTHSCWLIDIAGLIFLDEPTTGLDAYNSLCVMDMMNDLCREGRTVVWYDIRYVHAPPCKLLLLTLVGC